MSTENGNFPPPDHLPKKQCKRLLRRLVVAADDVVQLQGELQNEELPPPSHESVLLDLRCVREQVEMAIALVEDSRRANVLAGAQGGKVPWWTDPNPPTNADANAT